MKPLSLDALHDQLETEGYSLPEDSEWKAALQKEDGAPWFVRVLVGFGAWIAALMGVGALTAILTLSRNQGAWIVLGLLLCTGAILLRRSSQHDFAVQAALALSLAGQVMVFAGLRDTSRWDHRGFVTWFAMFTLEGLLIAYHRDPVHRFLSALAGGLFLDYLLGALGLPGEQLARLPLLILKVAIPGVLVLAWWLRPQRLWRGEAALCLRPVGYGLACAYLVLNLNLNAWMMLRPGMSHLTAYPAVPWTAARVILPLIPSLLLAYAGFSVLRRLELHRGATLALAGSAWTGLAVLGLWAPGLPAVFLVMVLAIDAFEPILFALASVAGAFLLSSYYYNLALTLLAKSGVLIASGALLLGVAYLLRSPKEVA